MTSSCLQLQGLPFHSNISNTLADMHVMEEQSEPPCLLYTYYSQNYACTYYLPNPTNYTNALV